MNRLGFVQENGPMTTAIGPKAARRGEGVAGRECIIGRLHESNKAGSMRPSVPNMERSP